MITPLTSALTDSSTSLPLAALTGLPTGGGTLLIDSEQITYTGISAGALTGVTRGANSTTAAAHNQGAAVTVLLSTAPTLGVTVSKTDTTLKLSSASGMASAGTIQIESEQITYSGLGTGNTLTGVMRGVNGTAAVGHNNGAQVSVLSAWSGLATGTALSGVTTGTSAMALGDVNGDGHLDLVLANNGGTGSLWLGDGTGALTAAPAGSFTAPSNQSVTTLALADLNGDGHLDLVLGSSVPAQGTLVLLGSAAGTLASAGAVGTTSFNLPHGPYFDLQGTNVCAHRPGPDDHRQLRDLGDERRRRPRGDDRDHERELGTRRKSLDHHRWRAGDRARRGRRSVPARPRPR